MRNCGRDFPGPQDAMPYECVVWTVRPRNLSIYFSKRFSPYKGQDLVLRGKRPGGEGALGRGRAWTELPRWDSQGRSTEQAGRASPGKRQGGEQLGSGEWALAASLCGLSCHRARPVTSRRPEEGMK